MPESSVLIALEEPMVLRILEHKLTREGHHVQTAATLERMRQRLQEGVDVALVAAAWSGDDALRSRPPRAGWFVVTNAFDHPGVEHTAMHDGAAGIVRMPFKPTVVAVQVATVLTMVRT
jgi:DNA-binding NtrC family response regulator